MRELFITIASILVLVKSISCELDVTCEPDDSLPRSTKRVCSFYDFPVSESGIQETYKFHVRAQSNEIERVKFKYTAGVSFIPPQIFTTFPNLQQLTMEAGVAELHPDNFVGAMNLTELILNRNEIEVIRRNVFTRSNHTTQSGDGVELPLQKLLVLSITGNGITDIEAHSFNGLNRLRFLDLAFNQLTGIRRQTFAGLPMLFELNLLSNRIESIEDGALDLPSLVILQLSLNKLRTLSDGMFAQLPKLATIELDRNGLEHIGRSLYNLSEIEMITMDVNHIEDIDLAKFAKLPKLQMLSLKQSGFTLATTKIEEGQKWTSPLRSLDIGDNALSDATELNNLKIFPDLNSLTLAGNPYKNLEVSGNRTLKDVLPALIELKIQNTEIQNIAMEIIEQKLDYRGR